MDDFGKLATQYLANLKVSDRVIKFIPVNIQPSKIRRFHAVPILATRGQVSILV